MIFKCLGRIRNLKEIQATASGEGPHRREGLGGEGALGCVVLASTLVAAISQEAYLPSDSISYAAN